MLSYYRARYYDPSVGRFISEDQMGVLLGSNFYKYVNNNVLNFVDPTGLSPRPTKPYRWRYCTGEEITLCKMVCEAEGKPFESCRFSQRWRIGPEGLKEGPQWVDGEISCSCKETECRKASVPDPRAVEKSKTWVMSVGIAVGIGAGLGLAPEATIPLLPVLLPKLAEVFAH